MEASSGRCEGLTKADARQRYPEAWRARQRDRWNTPAPGGECYADLARRAAAWWRAQSSGDSTLIVVTHEMMSRTLRGCYLGLDPAATLALDHPHELVFVLGDGTIEARRVD